MDAAITKEQIDRFAHAWYRALDDHEPTARCRQMLAVSGLSMRFPEMELHDLAGFDAWYEAVTRRFFDERHDVHAVAARIDAGRALAIVDIAVGWQASFWDPPAPRARRVSLDATQRWTVRPSDRNEHGLEIVTYDAVVEPFRYAPGFARL